MFLFLMGVVFIVVIIMNLIFYMVSYKNLLDSEISSAYECGFSISSGTRSMFSYRFFLVAILFLIFDVEITLMLPAPYVFLGLYFYIFLLVLVGGLLYEYYCGSLEWL